MDLDLALVRAFVATAGTLHFGRAAEELGTSQQALSKRVARLEEALGVRLFERRGGVRLSGAGERFLPAAREALAAGERAVASVTGAGPVVRIDTWGHLYAPMRTVAEAVQALGRVGEVPSAGRRGPGAVRWEPAPGRDWPSVAQALLRGDTDLGFGRVHPLPDGRDAGLTQRLVRLEPVDVVVGPSHPLAGAEALRPAGLRGSVLWCPAELNRLDFLRRFADEFGIARRHDGPNLGLDHLVRHLRTDREGFTLFPADAPLPDHTDVRRVPLVGPTPLYAWSLTWRESSRHPLLDTLLRGFTETGRARRWLEYDPRRDWLPDSDRPKLAVDRTPAR
ncbi:MULTISPECIES: LysR family transcriptional regulator [Streptomyces]|uniref:LysR family transcriptional regulator n=2 Tax=Streptomyces TaxID=1883 RepID=A0A2U9PB12_STRAS|nr:LysR family transcriptional regulator [Streptomyces actuosus]AWT46683.1 LysR family transcriptional regulator [Streptomyces actuosus]MBM4823414.1 LysR family transcriptional regulator [Streptomyces actuosus]